MNTVCFLSVNDFSIWYCLPRDVDKFFRDVSCGKFEIEIEMMTVFPVDLLVLATDKITNCVKIFIIIAYASLPFC